MADEIFISYRREESKADAGRLFDHLAQVFGRERVFLDVDAIEPGLDFVEVLNNRLKSCRVVLAIIGPRWAEITNENGGLRLDNPDDFVRVELESALSRNIRVIPVLVGEAIVPLRASIPESLGRLVTRQAIRLSHDRFSVDADNLINTLSKVIGFTPPTKGQLVETSGTPTHTHKTSDWSAHWIKKPAAWGWSMMLLKAGRSYRLECGMRGLCLDGVKIGEQPTFKFNHSWGFRIEHEIFMLDMRLGLWSAKSIKITVGSEIVLEWKST